jgi:hypothetical protein
MGFVQASAAPVFDDPVQFEPYARRVPGVTAADTTGTYSAKVGTALFNITTIEEAQS